MAETIAIAAVEWLTAGEVILVASEAAMLVNATILIGGLAYSAQKRSEAEDNARRQYNAAQVDRMASISTTTAPRELVLGRVRKGGAIAYRASTGSASADLYLVLVLAGHEIDAVEQIYLNDEAVTLDGNGDVTNAPYLTTTTTTGWGNTGAGTTATIEAGYVANSAIGSAGSGDSAQTAVINVVGTTLTSDQVGTAYQYQYTTQSSAVRITQHLGGTGQVADAALMAALPAAWTSAHIGTGVAYLVARLRYNEGAFASGAPKITAVVRGAKLYDPRSGLTVWSQNPALMLRHVYAHPKFGKASVTAAEDARFVAAANACDTATVYTVGGVAQASRALYQGALVVPYGTPAKGAFDDLAQAMGGSWAFAGGELYCKAGAYTASVMALTDADLAVVQRNGAQETQQPISISVHTERARKFNTVKCKIWDSSQDYKEAALTPLTSSALVTRDGAELVQEISLPGVGYAPQALHIAGIMMRDARDPLVVELPFKLRAYPLELFDTVDLTLSRYGWSSKTFVVLGRTWAADGTIKLTLKETTAAITQMDAGFSAQGFAANTNLPKPWEVADVGTLTISSGTAELITQQDGTVTSRMRVSWASIADAAVQQAGQIEVQYRRTDSGGAWASLVAAGNETQVVTADVQDGVFYVIRARAKNSVAAGAWGLQVQHQVIGKTEAPDAFDVFTVMAQPDGTRQYNFGYTTTPKPADWLGAEIRYISGTTSTPVWDDMTPLQDNTTYYTNSPVEINSPLAGVYTFACKSLDTSGINSTYKYANITLADRRLGNVFAEYYEDVEGWLGTLTSCHIQDGAVTANDSTTWGTAPATWGGWTAWSNAPASPIYYETPARDFGTIVAGQVNSTVDADGTVVQELATSTDGISWSGWSAATAAFATRHLKLRLGLTATGPAPIPMARAWSWQVNAPMQTEYLNDIVISALTGSYRIGTGDVRIPLAGVYTIIKRTTVVIQDSSAGTWTSTRIDQTLTYGPRWQFRLNGTLADPSFVDFFIEGY